MSMETYGNDTDQHVQADIFDTDFNLDKARNSKQTTARLCAYLMRQKRRLLAVLLCTIDSALFAILAPKVCGIAINKIFDGIQATATKGARFHVNRQTMGGILALLLGLYALESLADFLQKRTMASVAQTLTIDQRKEISEKLNHLPLRYFDQRIKGDILSRTVNDLEKVANALQDSLTQLLSSIDGTDITAMRRNDVRSLMGMVLQDAWLFGGTIRENISYGREHATDTEIQAAAKAARADHFIRTLPQGYDTVLNEETTSLSQRQRHASNASWHAVPQTPTKQNKGLCNIRLQSPLFYRFLLRV